jgi:hypothetical protein
VFAVQSEITNAVVEALRVKLGGGVQDRFGRAPTDDIEAYELFLHGRDFTPSAAPSAEATFAISCRQLLAQPFSVVQT